MKKIFILIFTCFIALLIASDSSNFQHVDAWKLNTHVYSANLILDDLEDQYLEINGNQYLVPDEIYEAIINNPASYRAGSLGPDIFPDLITGQGVIHPGFEIEDISAGDYLELIVSEYNLIPDSHPDKQKIFAFVLGYSLHYSGDLFGHSFINEYAGKAFPSIEEMATSSDDVQVALRHLVLEGYVDSHVPEAERTGENIEIDAPINFIKKALLERANEEYKINDYIASLVDLRNHLRSEVNNLKAYDPDQYMVEYLWDTNYAGYLDEWQLDIDSALTGWVQANHDMAAAMLDKESSHSETYDPIINWATENGTSVIGFPDFSLIEGLTEYVDNIIPDELIDEINSYVEETALELVKDTTGLDINEFTNAITNPNQFIDTDLFADGTNTSAIINDRLNNFGTVSNPSEIEFWPFYNTIIMGKLILLGDENLNMIFPNSIFEKQESISGFDEIKVKINTGENDYWSFDSDDYTKGTDDDVFFYIETKDNKKYSFLLDKPGYNDFESNDTDLYTLQLPNYITKEDIYKFGVRKEEIAGDDWWPDWIEVIVHDEVVYKNTSSFNKIFRTSTYWESEELSFASERTISTFDVSIISFIKSLDEGNQWIHSKIFEKDKDIFNTLFIGYEAPILNMEENAIVEVEVGSSELQQVEAYDYLGEKTPISYFDATTLEEFTFENVGTYKVIVSTKDTYDNTTKVTITINVVELHLELNPAIDTIYVGDTHIDESITVNTDLSTYDIVTNSTVDTTFPGTYQIDYMVTSGTITNTITRFVTVLEKEKEVVFNIEESLTSINFGSKFTYPPCTAILDGSTEVECTVTLLEEENITSRSRTVIFTVEGSTAFYQINYMILDLNLEGILPSTTKKEEGDES